MDKAIFATKLLASCLYGVVGIASLRFAPFAMFFVKNGMGDMRWGFLGTITAIVWATFPLVLIACAVAGPLARPEWTATAYALPLIHFGVLFALLFLPFILWR